jgi:hypothetical protein
MMTSACCTLNNLCPSGFRLLPISSAGSGRVLAERCYTAFMSRVYSAHVRGGVVIPDGVTLPDGTAVTIAVNDERDAEVTLSPDELAELDVAIAEADRAESVSSAVVLAELERIASSSKR